VKDQAINETNLPEVIAGKLMTTEIVVYEVNQTSYDHFALQMHQGHSHLLRRAGTRALPPPVTTARVPARPDSIAASWLLG